MFRAMELKARPLGSHPTCLCTACSPLASTAIAYVRGFTQDWMENGVLTSPTSRRWPSTVVMEMPNSSGS